MRNPFKRPGDGIPNPTGEPYRYSRPGSSNKLIIIAGVITFIVIIIVLFESVVIVQAGHRGVGSAVWKNALPVHNLCEFVISSHGHVDHAGGLLNIRNKMNREQSIPLLFHEDAFRKRMVKFHGGRIINLPEPNRSVLTKAGYSIIENLQVYG